MSGFIVPNGFGTPLAVTTRDKFGATICTPVVQELVAALIERKIDVMLVDPSCPRMKEWKTTRAQCKRLLRHGKR
jgi:hypothetical protein